MRALLFGLFLVLALGSAAHAQEHPFPTIYAYGEQDDDRIRECGVSRQSGVAQVQATLRASRVGVSPTPGAVFMYVNINTARVDALGCAYAMSLSFGSYGQTYIESTGETVTSLNSFCEAGSLLLWEPATAQAQINTRLAASTTACLSTFQTIPRS